MRANELRIGNLIDFEIEDTKGITRFTNGSITGIHSDCAYVNTIKIPRIDMLQPIRLTNEWLPRLGIKSDGYLCYKGNIMALKVTVRLFSEAIYMLIGDTYLGDRIKYVHEYQNLYFALTGQELKITNI